MQDAPSAPFFTFLTSKPSVLGSLSLSFSTAGESAFMAWPAAKAPVVRANDRERAATIRLLLLMALLSRRFSATIFPPGETTRQPPRSPRGVGRLQVFLISSFS